MNRHECERSISASSWIEINKLSRKNESLTKFSTQLDNGMASAISAYITYNVQCVRARVRTLFEGCLFFRVLIFFFFIIIIYSTLKPNYILCKVIKIIVIAAACFNNMGTAFDSDIFWFVSFNICYGYCCDDRYCCCCDIKIFASLFNNYLFVSLVHAAVTRKREHHASQIHRKFFFFFFLLSFALFCARKQ